MRTINEMLSVIPTPQKNRGGSYCEAVDEDLYDSSQWHNRMPSDGYEFYENEDGTCSVQYTNHFACWDGWDSMDSDEGTYPDKYTAVKNIYDYIELERLRKLSESNLLTWLLKLTSKVQSMRKQGQLDETYYALLGILTLFVKESSTLHR